MGLGGIPTQYAVIRDDEAHKGKTFFVISIHHTFFDAFSRFLMENDIFQILKSPVHCPREPERPCYGDFVIHMRAQPDYDARVSQYWSAYLKGAEFSDIHPQSHASSSGIQDGIIPWSRLEVTNSNSASGQQTALILAAWSLALAKQSGLQDIVFRLARHGRSNPHQDIRFMFGPLLTFMPLRLRFGNGGQASKDPETIRQLVHRVQDKVLITGRWEQGAIPGVYPDSKGSSWVQSLVNLKSELFVMPNGHQNEAGSGIAQKQDAVGACMGYRSSLIRHDKAESLFSDFKQLARELASGEGNIVDKLLT